ncbi:MAG: HEAT repeat domain-containing protein, partial [Ilumatobacteraceae bacterium]
GLTCPCYNAPSFTSSTNSTTAQPPPLRDDPAPQGVETAAWAAGEQECHRLVPELSRLAVAADDPLVREAAVAALGAIGNADGLPAILAACADRPPVRRRAVLALAPFDGPEVEAALEAARTDRDWQVRQAAEDVLPHRADD